MMVISGLPTVNFEMGFTKTRMGYNWGTIFFMMGTSLGT
jgi:hypothetical protein